MSKQRVILAALIGRRRRPPVPIQLPSPSEAAARPLFGVKGPANRSGSITGFGCEVLTRTRFPHAVGSNRRSAFIRLGGLVAYAAASRRRLAACAAPLVHVASLRRAVLHGRLPLPEESLGGYSDDSKIVWSHQSSNRGHHQLQRGCLRRGQVSVWSYY